LPEKASAINKLFYLNYYRMVSKHIYTKEV